MACVVRPVFTCIGSEGTDLIVPESVLEDMSSCEEDILMLAPFRVFIVLEDTGERVRAGALIVLILSSLTSAGPLTLTKSGVRQ